MKKAICVVLYAVLITGCASLKHSNGVISDQLIKSSNSWDGQPLPAYKAGTPEITILRITIPPNHVLPMHTHPCINAGILLKGKLTVVTDNGQVLHLKPYDPIIEVVDTWHYGNNEGDEPAEIIVFYAGENGEPITIKKQENDDSHNKELKATR